MNILVIGCDQVGASLIRDLERIGHDISLIERDPEQLKRLDAFDDYRFGGTALVGDPTDPVSMLNLQTLASYFMFVSFLPYGTFTVVTFVIRFF